MKARQIQKQLSMRQLHALIAGLGEYAAAEVLTDELGTTVTRSTARTLLRKVAQVAVDVTPDPGETEESIEDWLERQERQCARKVAKAKLHHRTFELPARPFALWVIGDPHLDNDGCDVATLRHELSVYQDLTDAYAICVGDMTDNWVGRLQKLYGSSNNTAHMGFRASQWLMEQASPFLALVGGNQAAWSCLIYTSTRPRA